MSPPVAIVTGAARGIGAAVAVLGARAGWQMVLVDSCADDPNLPYPMATEADLEATVAACAGHAVPLVGDVRSQSALDGAVTLAVEEFGGLDIAVAAAGVVGGGPTAWATDDALWDTVLDVNLGGVRRLARAAVPALLERPRPRSGRFVAVASASSTVGLPRLSAYAAAKHGVVGFVRSLAAELGPDGVTANAVAPGSTRTEGLAASAAIYGLESQDEFVVHHLDPRLLEPSEIAEAVVWLCSPASSGITGALIPVDAGMTAR
ncbi:MAG TPA: mycofactocin-coupled SDR family oxidoreductase [Acidimicrobiales bacterium]|jgi:SDR family mycofactocin-dependent oxidoreductase|nr:mycofactocin-coupled SDR family oxidoreductase [Acidimicrobiales bacterium]